MTNKRPVFSEKINLHSQTEEWLDADDRVIGPMLRKAPQCLNSPVSTTATGLPPSNQYQQPGRTREENAASIANDASPQHTATDT
jgi:hypothetical protein